MYMCISCHLAVDCVVTLTGVRSHAGFLDRRAVKAALQQARIVFTTCAGAGSQQVALQPYALLVVDEASQVPLHATSGCKTVQNPDSASPEHHVA